MIEGGAAAGEKNSTIRISFKFNAVDQTKVISIIDATAIDINKIAPDAVDSNTSFGYAGRHDHGSLPELRYNLTTGNVIASLQEAKRECDDFLTLSIKDELEKSSSICAGQQAEKKPRLD